MIRRQSWICRVAGHPLYPRGSPGCTGTGSPGLPLVGWPVRYLESGEIVEELQGSKGRVRIILLLERNRRYGFCPFEGVDPRPCGSSFGLSLNPHHPFEPASQGPCGPAEGDWVQNRPRAPFTSACWPGPLMPSPGQGRSRWWPWAITLIDVKRQGCVTA